MKAVALVAIAACGGPSYLGASLPAACTSREAEHCAGWLAERELGAGELDIYDNPALRDYVQGIADRLAHGTRLAHAPRVVIADHDGTYAAFGDRIVIGRRAIERLGTEAELAGIVAHELVHVEGHHASVSLFNPTADDAWLATRRDAEAIADERAVTLLERAGYAPAAMRRALDAELTDDDPEHPTRADRLARVDALAAGTNDGFEGRNELLEQVDRMVVGRDTRLGVRIGTAWVVAALGVTLELPATDLVRVDGDALVIHRGHSTLTVYAIGVPWARELAGKLEQRADTDNPLGLVAVGIAPGQGHPNGQKPLDKLEGAVHALLPQPAPGSHVVILQREHGALVFELSAHSDAAVRDRWLHGLRFATDAELTAAEPPRIFVVSAPHPGRVRELVAACPDPTRALALDAPTRVLAAGDPLKCTDR